MSTRLLSTAVVAAVAALGTASAADASSMSLGLNTSNVGEHKELDASTFFFPRNAVSWLRGTMTDDSGLNCYRTVSKTAVEPDFTGDPGIGCPSEGWFTWSVHATENTQYKALLTESPAESNVVTILTGPEAQWDGMWAGYRKTQIDAWSDSEAYAGTISVKQGGRVVKSGRMTGTEGHLTVKVAKKGKRCAGCLKPGAPWVATITPDDSRRWVTMQATGVSKRLKQGGFAPVL